MRTTLDIDADVLMAFREIAASGKRTAGKVLSQFTEASDHAFWADTQLLRDFRHIRHSSILTSPQITGSHLPAVAVENQSRLATCDRHIPLAAVPTAGPSHPLVLE